MRLVQLSRELHSNLRIDPDRVAALAANVHLVPVVRGELRRLAVHYPLLMAKNGETGEFYPAALMGLEPHENLYWNGAGLEGDRAPLNLLRQPFYVGGDDAADGVMCVDIDSSAIVETGGVMLVDPDGGDSGYIRSVQAMLGELVAGQDPTRGLVERAVALGLVTEIRIDIRFNNGATVTLEGFYGIDERAFERQMHNITAFDDVMDLAAMLLSQDHISGLVRRKNARLDAEAAWLGNAA